MNVAFLSNSSLIVTGNDRNHKPIFAFSDGDSLYFLGDVENGSSQTSPATVPQR
jgi:hypothetical protein